MKIKISFLLVACLLMLLAPNIRAFAAGHLDTPTNYCFPVEVQDRCLGAAETITALLAEWGLNLAVGTAKTVDGLIWLLDRAAAFVFDTVVNSDWLLNIKDQLLTSLSSMMPGVLRTVVMGNSGLMYIAMALAGVLMILPLIGADQTRLVRPERVMLWGVLLAVLFIGGSSTGYDLVDSVEGLRLTIMKNIIGVAQNPADKLIQSPMGASSREFQNDDLLKLPPSYENLYFPDATTIEVTIKFFPQIGPQNTFIETQDSAKARASLAGSSIFFSFVSLLGAYALLLFAITFAFLGVAALVLILFLFAALPLGFFEFGNIILKNIIEKYFQIVVFSLGISIFIRWVLVWIGSFPDASDVSSALTWAALLMVVIAVLHVILSGAFNTLISSAQVFSGSVQAVFNGGNMAAMGSGMFGAPAWAQAGNSSGGQTQIGASSPVTSLVHGALSAVGFHVAESVLPDAHPSDQQPRRADVFRLPQATSEGNGPGAGAQDQDARPQGTFAQNSNVPAETDAPRAQSSRPLVSAKPEIPGKPVFAPNPAEAETSLQAMAAREGWQSEQVEMIKAASRRNESPASLAAAPGFERSSPDTLQQAIRTAQAITTNSIVRTGPLIQPGTEQE